MFMFNEHLSLGKTQAFSRHTPTGKTHKFHFSGMDY